VRKEYDLHHPKFPLASLDGATTNYYNRCVFFLLNIFISYKPIGATPQRHFFGGEGGVWYEKGVTLRRLRISEKKEILRKLTVL
jgi:hypothetical protein